ncbi:MAG: hypothetical protein GY703_20035 [Gammaproteobacteria bacterium]|nr:hypothetical protein [Gammaproteobacteria bacterium]
MQTTLQAASLARLDAQNQRYETCQPPNADFSILPGDGYVVEMADSGQLTLSGEPNCPQLDLTAGINIIGIPTPSPGLSCYDLVQKFTNPEDVASVQRFDRERGTFVACALSPEGNNVLMGEDFTIVPGEAYLVSLRAAQTAFKPNDPLLCTNCLEPIITSIDPLVGSVGTTITITGENLNCSLPFLTLNGKQLPILSVTANQMTTLLPTGATDGSFSLTTTGGTAVAPPELGFDVTLSRDFALTLAPATGTLLQGSSTTFRVSASGTDGFSSTVSLAVSGLPQGLSAQTVPATITAGQSALISLVAATGISPGEASFNVTGQAPIDGSVVSHSVAADLSVLAGSGQTALLGQLRFDDKTPMQGVKLTLDGQTVESDAAGNFRFLDIPAGLQTVSIDTTPIDPVMPMYAVDVTVAAGGITRLPPLIHYRMPPPEAYTPLTQGAQQDQVFTSINAPGASLTLPAGATIVGWDGIPKDQLAIVRKDPDKLPVLPPPGPTKSVYHPMFGTPMGGVPSTVLPVTTPNDLDMKPGEQGDLWYYDAAPLPGAPGKWIHGGTATTSADGQTIVSDPGSGIGRFCGVCGLWCIIRKQFGEPNHCPDCPKDGDPVNLALGQMITEKTDLTLAGRIPAVVQRIHNPYDPFGGIAGVKLGLGSGWTLTVDMVLQAESADLRRLVLPGNSRYAFARQPDGSFINTQHQRFAGAVFTAAPGGHTLRLKDGTRLVFAESRIFGLDNVEFLVAQIDRNGNRLSIERDNLDKITRLIEPSGRAMTLSYGANDLISEIRDPLGRTVRYSYAGNRLETVTDPAGGVTRYTYDSQGRILSITDALGVEWLSNGYGSSSRVSVQTQADGGQWHFEYMRPCQLGETPHPLIGLCPVQTAEEFSTAAIVTDPRGSTTITRFSAPGSYANESVDALGQKTRIERDAIGQIMSVTDSLNRTTYFAYDDRGNLLETTDPEGNTTRFTYEPDFNQVTQITDSLGSPVTLEYDANGNLTRITDPLNQSTELSYDNFGQLTAVTDALDQTTIFEYDNRGNRIKSIDPLGNTLTQSFDPVSRRIAVTDPRGLTTRIVYDKLNQVVEIADPLNQITRFSFDPNGNLLSVADALDRITTYVYDEMDRLIERTDPLNASESFVYDKLGNLTEHTDRKGQVSTFEYDFEERLIRAEYADSAVDYVYDVVGRLAEVRDTSGGNILLTYDHLDRLIEEITERGVVSYGYDSLDRRSTMAVSGQTALIYAYDDSSRLTRITQGAREVAFEYDVLGRRARLILPNGIVTEYAYDAASRLTDLTYLGADASEIGDLTYRYDVAGNRLGVGGSLARTALPEAVDTSNYNAANRQTSFGSRQMDYDANGNLISIIEGADVTRLIWDARDRLMALAAPGLSASYAYDAFGRRAQKEIAGRNMAFVYDGVDIVREQTDTGNANLLRSLDVDELLAYGDAEFPLADGLGSALAMVDGGGASVTNYTYSPYGSTMIHGGSANAFQFTGRENDGAGLYYYRARYFHPQLKRFISEDPLGYGAGDMNLYAYVGANPINFADPFGQEKDPTGQSPKKTVWDEIKAVWDAVKDYMPSGASPVDSAAAGLGVIAEHPKEFTEGVDAASQGGRRHDVVDPTFCELLPKDRSCRK